MVPQPLGRLPLRCLCRSRVVSLLVFSLGKILSCLIVSVQATLTGSLGECFSPKAFITAHLLSLECGTEYIFNGFTSAMGNHTFTK